MFLRISSKEIYNIEIFVLYMVNIEEVYAIGLANGVSFSE